mgnify:CR=1 FL=1
MNEIPTFWQAFEAVGRIILMICGAMAPPFLFAGLVMALVERRRLLRWWRGK